MENEILNHAYAWYGIGVAAIILELTMGGIGLIFAGLGAITVGALVNFHVINISDSWLLEIAAFLILTFLWTTILWKPFKKLTKGDGKKYQDIINQEAAIYGDDGLEKGKTGNIKWSGSIVKARIAEDCSLLRIAKDESVYIVGKENGTLIISDKKIEG